MLIVGGPLLLQNFNFHHNFSYIFLNRNYMRKFADILKGRVTLELLHIPGSQEQRFEEMGENALCAAMELMSEVDDLREFVFLPRDLVATMNNTLFNVGQLISALLNLSLQRIDAFFSSLTLLDTSQRPAKLLEIVRIVSESLHAVHIDIKYSVLFRTLLLKVNHFISFITLFNRVNLLSWSPPNS